MSARPLYIFDLDGTLSDTQYRRHLVDRSNPEAIDWRAFTMACDQDPPIMPLIKTLKLLRASGADIWVFSARGSEAREKTEAWLMRHCYFTRSELVNGLLMRPENDSTPDDVLKKSWIENMLDIDRFRLVGIFDDRARVVKMWRSLGITCFQVADGGY